MQAQVGEKKAFSTACQMNQPGASEKPRLFRAALSHDLPDQALPEIKTLIWPYLVNV